MADVEIAVELLVVWLTRPEHEGTVARLDSSSDITLRALHQLVAAKLHGDPAFGRMELEASEQGEIRPRTRSRLAMAIEDATEDDHDFGKDLKTALDELRESDLLKEESRGSVTNQITGNVTGRVIQARDIKGSVTFYSDTKGS